MTAKEYYKSTRMVETINWTLEMALNFAEEYAEALQLQQNGVSGSLFEDEKLKIARTVLEWVGYERGFEFDDDNIMEVLRQNSL